MKLHPSPPGRRTAYAALLAGVLALFFAGKVGAQGLTPGTVKLLSKNPILTEAETADAFVSLSPTQPAKFLITGPVRLQADFRVSLPPGQAQGEPVLIDVFAAGKPLRRFKIMPKAGTNSWKETAASKPSAPVGFYIEVDPGPHAYEVRVTGAPNGAALFLVPDAKARRPLAANAPVVPPKPPAPAATPAAAQTQIAKATPAPTPRAKSLDDITATGRPADTPMERLSYDVGFKGGIVMPFDTTFAPTMAAGAEVRWSLGEARLFGLGLEVMRMQVGGVDGDDPRRADAPFALNVALTPVIAHATFWIPSEGRLRPYLAAGGGFVYAESLYEERNQSVAESTVGPAAQALAGLQIDLSPTDLREGRQKIFLEVKGTWLQAPVEAHDYAEWGSLGIVAGVDLKF